MGDWLNPILPGFHPDPSVVRVDGVYYLVTSTFEYLPAMPIHRSIDLVNWELIGHVATQSEHVEHSLTPGGVWAPTIRYHDGVFYVIVGLMLGTRGCVVFSAPAAAGPWSTGTDIPAVEGIDPDLAWDEVGTAYVTYATFGHGIRQVQIDLATGRALDEPRPLWSGTGLRMPEAPHLYQRGRFWYLLIAEGGTERGHAVSVARGPTPAGPFTGYEGNPVLSARSTDRGVQNTGHADLVEGPDGRTVAVLLGVRPVGYSRSFSPLGRETFITDVDWIDDWPILRPVETPLTPRVEIDKPDWIAIRRPPESVITLRSDDTMTIAADGSDLSSLRPAFVGRRVSALTSTTSVQVDASAGVGGLAARHDERLWFALEASGGYEGTRLTARAVLAGIEHTWQSFLPAGAVELRIEARAPSTDRAAREVGGDRIRLTARSAGEELVVAEFNGGPWSFESSGSFTGRVVGMYATAGVVGFSAFRFDPES